MTDINHTNFIGRIVKDTVLEETPKSKVPMARFSVAVNRDVKGADGKYNSKPTYIDLAIFANRAEKLAPYLKQGTLVAIEGYLDQQIWTKDDVTKSKLTVVVEKIQLLKGKDDRKESESSIVSTEPTEVTFAETDNEINYLNEVF